MKKRQGTVHLGFEIGSGAPVAVPIAHAAVIGQTQQSGKTTALEAMVQRSGLRAIAFVTKRGEGSFGSARRIAPYFRERADWQFVAGLIDATLGEKNKLLRAWLMKVCRGTRTLAEVHANVRREQIKARGFSESIYTEIDGYLDLVVPQLAELPPADRVEIGPGLNVMDLSAYTTELQALVISSAIDWVQEREEGVVTVVPEAWEFLPEGRGGPAKSAAERLIRKGAGLGNFIWIDSQDTAGVMKLALRACSLWLIGVQREANELKRNLLNIPAGVGKPKPSEVAQLELGQFFACWQKRTAKVYVQPAWMSEGTARRVATGELPVEDAPPVPTPPRVAESPKEKTMKEQIDLDTLADKIAARMGGVATAPQTHHVPVAVSANGDEESLYQRFKARLMTEAPGLVKLMAQRPELRVEVERVEVVVDGGTCKGRVGKLIANGFFRDTVTFTEVRKELGRTGPDVNNKTLSNALKEYVALGFLTDEADGYRGVEGMKSRLIEK